MRSPLLSSSCSAQSRSGPPFLDLLPVIERVTGRRIAASFGLNPAVKMRIESGETFDVAIINGEMLEDLIRQGKIAFGSQRAFGRVGLGVAVRAGAPKPDLRSVEALKRALVSAKSIAYAGEGSSGAHFTALLARLGIQEEVGPKLRSVGGGETGQVVATGEAELGVVPVTTILAAAPGAELAGMFPAELQSYIDFAAGLSAAATDVGGGNALLNFLTGPESDELLKSKGVERLT
ncbi:substrate-binding domain-containing protein [Inquilinus ginsengisoli]|uniref:substrate-binding domain-containing protein n=1 Tax=Inquilinus ginsengisoli TaxID=363840 RepID=UPI003D253FF1